MRIRADKPEARNVQAILLDGKVVPMCYEADEEEGWVKSYSPVLPEVAAQDGEDVIDDDETYRAGFTLIRRRGKVSIRFKDDSSMGNR